ncbi:hypothetical protein AAHA92_09808 [Salvia divinorum]|uniref:Uncharacterized protein n=1 Tax=Salvia divinorum TaxID=28513 RepID=A0ABD1HSJ5_SALDI
MVPKSPTHLLSHVPLSLVTAMQHRGCYDSPSSESDSAPALLVKPSFFFATTGPLPVKNVAAISSLCHLLDTLFLPDSGLPVLPWLAVAAFVSCLSRAVGAAASRQRRVVDFSDTNFWRIE